MKTTDLMVSLLSMLEQGGAVSIPQCAAMFGVDEDEVYDALETLAFAYDEACGIRLELGEHGCAFARLMSRSGAGIRMTMEQTDVLVDALRACGIGAGSELVAKLVAAKGTERSAAPAELASAEPGERGEVLLLLAEALRSGSAVAIEYQGARDAAPRMRVVQPEQVLSQDGHRYLQAWCYEAGAERDFRLDRIRSARLATGDEPAATGSKAKQAGPQQAKIVFEPGAPLPIWPGARVQQLEDGSALVTVKWLGGGWLPQQLAAQLGSARVAEPAELACAVRDYAAELLGVDL